MVADDLFGLPHRAGEVIGKTGEEGRRGGPFPGQVPLSVHSEGQEDGGDDHRTLCQKPTAAYPEILVQEGLLFGMVTRRNGQTTKRPRHTFGRADSRRNRA